MAKPVPLAYADCIDIACPRCGVEPREWCVNPINGRPSAIACAERYRAAEGVTDLSSTGKEK